MKSSHWDIFLFPKYLFLAENTRKIYQRKLAVVLGGEVGNFSRIADTSQLDGNFSQEEEDAQPTQAYIGVCNAIQND